MHFVFLWPECICCQPNAFKWSLEHQKMHFVSIQTVSKMHLLEPKNEFCEHQTVLNAFVSEPDWQVNAFKWSFGSI